MTTDLATTEQGQQLLERVVIGGDLSKLTSAERLQYYRHLCASCGLNPLTRPFQYLTLSNRLTLYATKDATDQLRALHGVSITKLERETVEGVYCVTAYATDAKGRTDSSIGAVSLENLRGDARANAIMRSETKSKRRVTLSLCGLGMLDETEIETIPEATRTVVDHDTGEIVTPTRAETPDQETARLFPTPAEEDARTILGRIEAGFARLKMDEPSRRGAWSTHCGSAPYLNPNTDVAALGALLADLRARAKAAR